METALKIRRLCLVEGKSISEVARRFHLSRTTVRKYLKDDQPPAYHLSKPRARPRLGDYEVTLTRWLEQDQARPKREQRTAMRLFEDLQKEGYAGAYDSVVRFVRAFRQEQRPTEAYIPLSFDPGEAYQFDWSHEQVELGGMPQKVKVAHFRLSYSRKPFVVAYPRESLEMVLDAHMRALAFYQGIPRRVIIDNPKTMVQTIGVGKGRQFNTRFLAMMNHYLIEPVACTPAAGWEKGQVENQVSAIRQWLFTPKPRFRDLQEHRRGLPRGSGPVPAAHGPLRWLQREDPQGLHHLPRPVRPQPIQRPGPVCGQVGDVTRLRGSPGLYRRPGGGSRALPALRT
jgi:transposase